jgi:hypothetical protein
MPELGIEIAKVALRSKLDQARVVEHRLISTGKVRKVVRSSLRSLDREALILAAIEATTDLETLVDEAKAAGF